MPIVVRYVNGSTIKEDFLGFAHCDTGTSGQALATLIMEKLKTWGLDLQRLRGQGYDGAGNMAGHLSGCAAIISQSYPKAMYVHCSSHCLNLCVVSASKVKAVSNMCSVLLEVSMFFKYSPKRHAKLEETIKQGSETARITKLVDLCKTRWVARSTALVTFEALYGHVVATLEAICGGTQGEWNADSQSSAGSLLRSITSFEFIVTFVITSRVMAHLHSLTIALQSSSLDIVHAFEQIESVRENLAGCRTEEQHQSWFDEAVKMAETVSQTASVFPLIE